MFEQDYTIFVISNKPYKFSKIAETLKPERVNYFDGSGYESFSKLVNSCVQMCPTEKVIILSDKVLPNTEHIQKIIRLIDSGYALVGLYRFACFGFKKELLRRIGMFDERYIGGGFEDYDFIVRLIEANASMYITEEIPYETMPSSWDYNKTYPFWCTKWKHTWESGKQEPIKFERTLEEEKYDYKLGPSVPCEFFPLLEHSYVTDVIHTKPFFYIDIPRGKDINDV